MKGTRTMQGQATAGGLPDPSAAAQQDDALDDLAAETKSRTSRNKELDAIRRITTILEPLSLAAQERVWAFMHSVREEALNEAALAAQTAQ